jgi:FtsP/CotA-like multicopper oxidase with cupredoxin domain
MYPRSLAALFLLLVAPWIRPSAHGGRARVRINDNRRAAGTLRSGLLTLHLEARLGVWHPDGDSASGAEVPAFGEAAKPTEIPGPLIRVPAGTEVALSVRNAVPNAVLTVHGLHARPLTTPAADTLQITSGATRPVRFRLDAPGTYYYWGTTMGRELRGRTREDAQLSGAIIVDEPGQRAPGDRILVIGVWEDTMGGVVLARERERELMVVNGRSWPHTERLSYTVGDTVRWRVLNVSADVHPMHR